jgi:hypothetical protein
VAGWLPPLEIGEGYLHIVSSPVAPTAFLRFLGRCHYPRHWMGSVAASHLRESDPSPNFLQVAVFISQLPKLDRPQRSSLYTSSVAPFVFRVAISLA